jgi:hypothetical protein
MLIRNYHENIVDEVVDWMQKMGVFIGAWVTQFMVC